MASAIHFKQLKCYVYSGQTEGGARCLIVFEQLGNRFFFRILFEQIYWIGGLQW